MKIKLLKIELIVDEKGENFEIITNYGSILDNENFFELKEEMKKLKNNFEQNVRKILEE